MIEETATGVGVLAGVRVLVAVGVNVDVDVLAGVDVNVAVFVGARVFVAVGANVGVLVVVGVEVGVRVGELVGVAVHAVPDRPFVAPVKFRVALPPLPTVGDVSVLLVKHGADAVSWRDEELDPLNPTAKL
jgi:hypothetical protein